MPNMLLLNTVARPTQTSFTLFGYVQNIALFNTSYQFTA
jgi:hypothetical protein